MTEPTRSAAPAGHAQRKSFADTLVAAQSQASPELAALARLAFGGSSAPGPMSQHRHLAFLPPEALDLDLSDPAQRQLGDYELLDKLGQGGMGVVYRARQHSLKREVALKLLAAGPWASDDFIERFRREAQSAARLNHPNIVAIHEIGRHDDLNYFSMQLVRGRSLAQVIQQEGPQPIRRSAQWLRSIAEAADYAHRLGLLHLDLKPGNILIDESGEPHVADFGLARPLDSSLGADSDEISGTPSYMAPEQAVLRTHRLSAATDIYGLGAILYELLTGTPPFRGSTPADTLQQVLSHAPAAPSGSRKDLPRDLEAICLKCLEKTPQLRYRHARELAEDLGRFLEGRAVSVRSPGFGERALRFIRREPRLALAIGACALAILIGWMASTLQWRRAEASAEQARHSLWRERTATAETALAEGNGFHGLQMMVANLREMRRAQADAAADIEAQRIGTLLANAPRLADRIPLEEGQVARSVALAPDGERFAVATFWPDGRRSVRQYELASGRELWATATDDLTFNMVLSAGAPHGVLRYSADGTRLIVGMLEQPVFAAPTTPDQIALSAVDGRVLQPPSRPVGFSDIVHDDQARHAIVRWRTQPSLRFPDRFRFYQSADWTPVGPEHGDQSSMWLFAPDGERLLRTTDFQHFELVEFGSLRTLWRLALTDAQLVRAWRFTPDGRWLALGGLDGSVHLIDVDSGTSALLPAAPVATIRWLEFGADSQTLAALSESGQVAVWDLATRVPRIAPLQLEDVVAQGRLRLSGDLLAVAHGHAISLYQLPPIAAFTNHAVPVPARVLARRPFTAHGFDLDASRRLLVSGGDDGAISVWQLPPAPLRAERAAPLAPITQGFDGQRLVSVDGATVRVVDVQTGVNLLPPLQHPQAVDFAELSADGRWLVTIAQRTLRVFDADRGDLHGAPLILAATPLQAELASSAPRLLLISGMAEASGFVERAQLIDLDAVASVVDGVALPRQHSGFALDPRGHFLLAVRFDRPEIERITLDGQPGCPALSMPAANAFGAVVISPEGDSAWAHLSLGQRRAALVHWRLDDCSVHTLEAEPHLGMSAAIVPVGKRALVHRHRADALALYGHQGRERVLPTLPAARTMALLSVSADHRRVAIATRNAVQVYDLAQGERLSALLTAPIPGDDAIQRLVLARDGRSVLARSMYGRWLHWPLPTPSLDQTALQQLAASLDPNAATPTSAEAAALRAQLRGLGKLPVSPPSAAAPVMLAAEAAAGVDARFVPVDFGSAANVQMRTPWIRMAAQGGDLWSLARGIQRLGGIDWQMGPAIQLSGGGPALSLHPRQPWSDWIEVPPLSAARVHLLMLLHVPTRPPARRVGLVQLRHADGRESQLEIQSIRDVVTHWQPDLAAPSARAAWRGVSAPQARQGESQLAQSLVYAVSLDLDPHATPVSALRLGIGNGPMEAPLYYAVTLERASTGVVAAEPAR